MKLSDDSVVSYPATKLVTLWGMVSVSNMADVATLFGAVASFLAAFYSFLLIFDWFWRKIWRPLFERKGWIDPLIKRRRTDPKNPEEDSANAPLL